MPDLLILFVLTSAMFFVAFTGARRVSPAILTDMDAFDTWFDGDNLRYFDMMSIRDADATRTTRHPLFPLFAYPPVKALMMLRIDRITAARISVAGVGATCIALLFLLLRCIGCRRFDAALFSLVLAVSAASMFWFVLPESYPFGSASILLAVFIVALGEVLEIAPWWYLLVSAVTLSFTTTNWMIGILATFARLRWRKAVQVTVGAFMLVLFLWGIQKAIFPRASFFFYLPTASNGGDQFVMADKAGGLRKISTAAIFHSMVMPDIKEGERFIPEDGPVLTVQHSAPGSTGFWGKLAVGAWILLLAFGVWSLIFLNRLFRPRVVLALGLIGLLAVHSLFGIETFLYSLHFIPLLVAVAALGTLTRARPLVLALAGILVVSAGVNNAQQFDKATKFVAQHHTTQHQEVRAAMAVRFADPWPRSTGHVVLGTPGSLETDKGYYEPGGSFSPGVGSFGISIWIADDQGKLLRTSDTISLNLINQRLSWDNKISSPAIVTDADYYQTSWSSAGGGVWTLNLRSPARVGVKRSVAIRSVGPAGGPITSLGWNGQRLLVNGRWSITMTPSPSAVNLSEEGPEGWITARSKATEWSSSSGWGYARLELDNESDWNLVVQDMKPGVQPFQWSSSPLTAGVELELPDPRFAASMNAQVAHLMMGLVGQEARAADPTEYPIAWTRPEAYVVAALARAGRLGEAKELSTHLAENDFLGGFGPEADAIGLAIWSLQEVALRVNQQTYDDWLWPHIQRKANLILQMLSNTQPLSMTPVGPVIPTHRFETNLSLIAEPPQNGLIVGKSEAVLRPLFVTAVSYRGLLDASLLAERVNQSAEAERFRAGATQLKRAWQGAFAKLESTEPGSYSVWPTAVWESDGGIFFRGLQNHSSQTYNLQGEFRRPPLRTYNDIAEAHQWLFFGREDRVWTTLNWFWNHQASPGLYTWWEDGGFRGLVITAFRRWEQTRGWLKRPHVTPQYHSASEMLLLQLDMLAYFDELESEPTIVVAPGIPVSWLDKPMSVRGVSTRMALVDWTWNKNQMQVTLRGCHCKVRLGPQFSPNTPLRVDYFNPTVHPNGKVGA